MVFQNELRPKSVVACNFKSITSRLVLVCLIHFFVMLRAVCGIEVSSDIRVSEPNLNPVIYGYLNQIIQVLISY